MLGNRPCDAALSQLEGGCGLSGLGSGGAAGQGQEEEEGCSGAAAAGGQREED